jgi:hypothetical protein
MIPSRSASRRPSPGWLWVMRPLLGLLLGIGGVAGGSAMAGLIGYLQQSNDHRFEPWVGDDPSYSEDPLNTLGPPLSPLALFPWMWQRHHAGDVVSRHTVELLEAEVVRPVPKLSGASREGKPPRGAGPWRTRRNLAETYRELIGELPRELGGEAAREENDEETKEQSAPGAKRRNRRAAEDDESDDD